MQRSMSKMLVREDEVEQRAALEEEKARRERAKKLRCEASRKRYLRAEEEHAHVGERQGPGQAPHGAARGAGQQRQQRQRVAAAALRRSHSEELAAGDEARRSGRTGLDFLHGDGVLALGGHKKRRRN